MSSARSSPYNSSWFGTQVTGTGRGRDRRETAKLTMPLGYKLGITRLASDVVARGAFARGVLAGLLAGDRSGVPRRR